MWGKILGKILGGDGLAGKIIGLVENKQERATLQKRFDQVRAEWEHEIEKDLISFAREESAGQLEVNKVEDAHASTFVSGWRPFIGWTCGVGLAYNFLLYHFLAWAWVAFAFQGEAPPNLETGELMPLLMGMLGMGGLRTFEKVRGVARSS